MTLREAESDIGKGAWALALGAGVGLAAGYVLWRQARSERHPGARERGRRLEELETQVVDALRADSVASQLPIDVAALAEGIVELSGAVETDLEGDRAVMVAQAVPHVRTVLNRIDIRGEVERMNAARHEQAGPGTAKGETHWYGMEVGTGMRRQGRSTDPGRKDQKVDILQASIGVDRVVENPSEDLDKVAPAVQGQSSGAAAPEPYGTVRDASHRHIGNVPERSPQDLNPESAVHENVKPGTKLTLEEDGAEGELQRRGLEDQS